MSSYTDIIPTLKRLGLFRFTPQGELQRHLRDGIESRDPEITRAAETALIGRYPEGERFTQESATRFYSQINRVLVVNETDAARSRPGRHRAVPDSHGVGTGVMSLVVTIVLALVVGTFMAVIGVNTALVFAAGFAVILTGSLVFGAILRKERLLDADEDRDGVDNPIEDDLTSQ